MLKNKIAVITRAGIGEATARIFARESIEGIAIVAGERASYLNGQ